MGEVVVNEWLDKQRVHALVAPPRKRPLIVCQRPNHPVPRCGQYHQGGSRTPLAVAQQRFGRRRKRHRWSKAPEQFAGMTLMRLAIGFWLSLARSSVVLASLSDSAAFA